MYEDLHLTSDVFFQLQVQQQGVMLQPDSINSQGEDDVDAALNDLQVSLEGSSLSSPGDIMNIPELQDYLRFYKYVAFVKHVFIINMWCRLLSEGRLLWVTAHVCVMPF